MSALILLAAVLLVACAPEPAWVALGPETDLDRFIADVQPVFEARCANPACHGSADRPLALYAPRLFRDDESRTWLDEPLSDEELAANHRRSRAFLSETPSESQLLLKPLAEDAGGCWHEGADQFSDSAEAEYHALLDWASGLPLDVEEDL